MKTEIFEVMEEQEGERLDKFLSIIYPDTSRSFFQKLIKDNGVLVNDKPEKSSYRMSFEDVVTIHFPDAVETTIEPEDIPLDILYEDDDLLIVNKPKGMVVHPSAGHFSGTLVNAIMFHCKDSLSGINGEIRPGIVHRIDMDTTGSLIVCKNDASHVNIAEQIKDMELILQHKKKEKLNRSVTFYQLGIFALILVLVLYACVVHLFSAELFF